MKQKDIAEIASKGFDKKWWQKHRSSKAKASGVGKALVAWVAAGMPPQGKLAELTDGKQMEAAFSACAQLKKALEVAGGKTKGKAKDTYDGIQRYEVERKKHEKALTQLYEQKKTLAVKQRKEFVSKTATRLDLAKKDTASIREVLKKVGDLEKLSTVAVRGGNPKEIDRYLPEAQKLLKTARSHAAAIDDRWQKSKAWDNQQKSSTFGPTNMGIMPKDKLVTQLIKGMQAATKNIFDTTTEKEVAGTLVEEVEEHVQAISDLKTEGNLSLNDWLEKATQIKTDTDTYVSENGQYGAGRLLRNALRSLKNLQQFLPQDELTKKQMEEAEGNHTGVYSQASRLPKSLTQIPKLVKQKNRIPKEFQKHESIKPLIDAIDKNVKESATIAKRMKQVTGLADKTLTELQGKPIIG